MQLWNLFQILFPLNSLKQIVNFRAANLDLFHDDLASIPWHMAKSDDVNIWWIQWKDLFLAAAHNSIPSVKWKRYKLKTWLSYETIKLTKKKRSLYRKFRCDPSLRPKYNQLRNLVRKATRSDYAAYADRISHYFHSNTKLFWSWVNRKKAYRSPFLCVIIKTSC